MRLQAVVLSCSIGVVLFRQQDVVSMGQEIQFQMMASREELGNSAMLMKNRRSFRA